MENRISLESLKNQEPFLAALLSVINATNLDVLLRDLAETQSLLRLHPLLISNERKVDELATTLLLLEEALRQIDLDLLN